MMSGGRLINLRFRIVLLVVLVALLLGFYVLVLQGHLRSREAILQGNETALTREYRIIQGIYGDMADSIFRLRINTPPVLSIMAEAARDDDSTVEDAARERLYEELHDTYRVIQDYDFRQLHFHQPDSRSFLRFHRPDTFGDDLTGFRYSVEYTNRNRAFSSGFEEGRIFNGFRYVYPLIYDSRHIGSVEVSISMKTVIRQIQELFGKQVQFILSAEVVREKVFAEELDNYLPWAVDPRFMLDRAVSDCCILDDVGLMTEAESVRAAMDGRTGTSSPFSLVLRRGSIRAILTFIPVINLQGRTVGWLFAIDSYEALQAANRRFLLLSVIFLLMLALAAGFTAYFLVTQKRIESMAIYDALTGCYSRGALFDRIRSEDERFRRYGTPYALIMLDIDHFKRVNDHYGHQAGDAVLKDLAVLIDQDTRSIDLVGRYGGEEFIVVLPSTGLRPAADVAEKLRRAVELNPFPKVGTVSVSCGVAERREGMDGMGDVIRQVDENLYRAKREGRNRVVS